MAKETYWSARDAGEDVSPHFVALWRAVTTELLLQKSLPAFALYNSVMIIDYAYVKMRFDKQINTEEKFTFSGYSSYLIVRP